MALILGCVCRQVNEAELLAVVKASRIKAIESSRFMERAMGIEPTSEAWEALDKTLKAIDLAALSFPSDDLNWKLGGN